MKIGPKIRRLRKLRGLTIEELAANAELTKGFISQLERDLTVPSVVNLKQILDVLGVHLSSFFSDVGEQERNIFIKKDRTLELQGDGIRVEKMVPKLRYLEMDPYHYTLEPGIEYEVHFEEDEGFGFVSKGSLEIKINDESKVVNSGDCFYIFFDSNLKLKNLSKKSAEILIVNY